MPDFHIMTLLNITKLAGFILCFFCFYTGMMFPFLFILASSILILNILYIYHVKNNYNMLIIFGLILFFNYSILFANIFLPFNSDYIIDPNLPYAKKSLNILFIFNYLLAFTIPDRIHSLKEQHFEYSSISWNSTIKLLIVIFLTYILLFEFEASAKIGNRASGSPLYEYSVILTLLGILFSNSKRFRFILLCFSFLFIIQETIYGGRITSLQYLICIYICFLANKYSPFAIFPFALILLLLFSTIGNMRGTILIDNIAFSAIFDSLKEKMFALDTAYSAYYTSEINIRVADIIQWETRLDLFLDFLRSIFLGEGGQQDRILANYTRTFFWHSWGGLLPHQFYFFLGPVGLVIPILILRFYFKLINTRSFVYSPWKKAISVFITISCARWYLYSPLVLIRAAFFLIILYYLFLLINRSSNSMHTT